MNIDNFVDTPLYGLQSKKVLSKKIGSHYDRLRKIVKDKPNNYNNFTKIVNLKKRNLYNLHGYFKKINAEILVLLSPCVKNVENLFSKKKSDNVKNAKYHKEAEYVLTIDICNFFPTTTRGKVFKFFKNKLCMQPDVADFITELTTIEGHIAQGLSTSTILSYLVNEDMFQEIRKLLGKNKKMSIYVDDLTFSSDVDITEKLMIIKIIEKYGYTVNPKKIKYFDKNDNKIITGVTIHKDTKKLMPLNKHCKKLRIKEDEAGKIMSKESIEGLKHYSKRIVRENYI